MQKQILNKYYSITNFTFPIVTTIIIVVFYLFFSSIISILLNHPKEYYAYIIGFLQITTLLLPVIIISKIVFIPLRKIFRFPNIIKLKYLFIAILGLVAFNIFLLGYNSFIYYLIPENYIDFFNYLKNEYKTLILNILGAREWSYFFRSVFVIAIIPAICEEALFRGFMQRLLEDVTNYQHAIILTGIVFGIIHLNIIDGIPLVIFGIYLGFAANYSNTLIIPIILHFINNTLSIVIFHIGYLEKFNNLKFSFYVSLLVMLLGIILISLTIYSLYKNRTKTV